MREPWLDDGDVRVWHGNALDCLRELPSESVQMILTSPPFFGLRDYGTGRWEGGDGDCDHKASKWSARGRDTSTLGGTPQNHENAGQGGVCRRCGARRVDDQIGIEPTPEEWVEKLVDVLREARRVLRNDGVCWIEVGDTYTSTGGERTNGSHSGNVGTADAPGPRINPPGLKPKDLIGAPWMLAFALRADGWWLRAENIWHKRNPMPESATDRTTRAHSQVFLLSKAATYFYDADAIAEDGQDWSSDGPGEGILTTEHYGTGAGRNDGLAKLAARYKVGDGPMKRNARSVWDIATATMKDAHFAVMPDDLAEKCIKAGTSEHGCCGECGAPWRRVVEKGEPELRAWSATGAAAYDDAEGGMVPRGLETGSTLKHGVRRETTGWEPTCACGGVPGMPDAYEVIKSPTGSGGGHDPSKLVGRGGLSRPRGEDEGTRAMTRFEQRAYADQLKASSHVDAMALEGGRAFAHYIRKDRAGARAIPAALLESWIERGWLERVSVPGREPPSVVPCVVLDPFMGSGTTALVARRLSRRSVGVELSAEYLALMKERLKQPSLLTWRADADDRERAAEERG